MSMRRLMLLSAALLTLPGAVAAQRVVADIAVRQGPVTGRIVIGDPYHVRPRYDYPRAHTVIVYRSYRGRGWYPRHGYRAVRVWYDYRSDRYFDRYDDHGPGLREIVVYERGGHYYRDDDRNDDRNGYRRRVADRGRGHDDEWDMDDRYQGDQHHRGDRR